MSPSAVAGFVGLELLKGTLAFVGGQGLSNALGLSSIQDVRIWIRAAVEELKAFVSKELQRNLDNLVLVEMEAKLAAILINIDHYAQLSEGSRETKRGLLEEISKSTALLVPRSLQFDQAYFVATTAIAYRLFVLYALYQLDEDKGHITSAKQMIDSAVRQLELSRNRLSQEMSPEAHFDIVCETKRHEELPREEIPRGPPTFRFIMSCFGTRDGHPVTNRYSEEIDRIGDAPTTLTEKVEAALEPLTTPMRNEARDFLEMANTSLLKVVQCYDRMCQKIGQSYESPIDAGTLTEMDTADIAGLIEMPGATFNRAIE